MEAWFGARRDECGLKPEDLNGNLPLVLHEFYEFAGRWPGVYEQNQLLVPPRGDSEGRLVFYVENQGVAQWATTAGDDPPVWIEYESKWRTEGEPLSRFLLQTLLVEAALRAPYVSSASGVENAVVAAATQPLNRLPLAAWIWPVPTSFYAGVDVIALVRESQDSSTDVWINGRDPHALTYLDALPPDIWVCYWRELRDR